ncbi:hypothetical protein ISREJYDI_CDS0071 [Pseudomonas phage UNO-G1W1]|jgi:hypothetical protein|uniref:Uncharacterized protein n=1 Tax=Pseudomonas phage UNO-G1W1 TaxID=3136609 RepID=A0AAX4QMF5_9CAUD
MVFLTKSSAYDEFLAAVRGITGTDEVERSNRKATKLKVYCSPERGTLKLSFVKYTAKSFSKS